MSPTLSCIYVLCKVLLNFKEIWNKSNWTIYPYVLVYTVQTTSNIYNLSFKHLSKLATKSILNQLSIPLLYGMSRQFVPTLWLRVWDELSGLGYETSLTLNLNPRVGTVQTWVLNVSDIGYETFLTLAWNYSNSWH